MITTEKVVEFIANNIVSWIIETIIMVVIALFVLQEVRQTGEETRKEVARIGAEVSASVDRFEESIANYAKLRAGKVDETAKETKKAVKEKFQDVTSDDVKQGIRSFLGKGDE